MSNCSGRRLGGFARTAAEMRTNFIAPASLLAELANRFAARGSGTLVGISSVAGDRARRGNYVYGTAKGALSLFLAGLRARLREKGVRVVTVKPGFVDTPMAEWTGLSSDQMIQPEDCAAVVRMVINLSPGARIPQIVIERTGALDGDRALLGA